MFFKFLQDHRNYKLLASQGWQPVASDNGKIQTGFCKGRECIVMWKPDSNEVAIRRQELESENKLRSPLNEDGPKDPVLEFRVSAQHWTWKEWFPAWKQARRVELALAKKEAREPRVLPLCAGSLFCYGALLRVWQQPMPESELYALKHYMPEPTKLCAHCLEDLCTSRPSKAWTCAFCHAAHTETLTVDTEDL